MLALKADAESEAALLRARIQEQEAQAAAHREREQQDIARLREALARADGLAAASSTHALGRWRRFRNQVEARAGRLATDSNSNDDGPRGLADSASESTEVEDDREERLLAHVRRLEMDLEIARSGDGGACSALEALRQELDDAIAGKNALAVQVQKLASRLVEESTARHREAVASPRLGGDDDSTDNDMLQEVEAELDQTLAALQDAKKELHDEKGKRAAADHSVCVAERALLEANRCAEHGLEDVSRLEHALAALARALRTGGAAGSGSASTIERLEQELAAADERAQRLAEAMERDIELHSQLVESHSKLMVETAQLREHNRELLAQKSDEGPDLIYAAAKLAAANEALRRSQHGREGVIGHCLTKEDDKEAALKAELAEAKTAREEAEHRAAESEGQVKDLLAANAHELGGTPGETVRRLQQLLAVKCRSEAAKETRLKHALEDRDVAMARAERAEVLLRMHEGLLDDSVDRLAGGWTHR